LAAIARICSLVVSLNFIEQKSGPLPAWFTPDAPIFYQKEGFGATRRVGGAVESWVQAKSALQWRRYT
jgi:hypothetical protein